MNTIKIVANHCHGGFCLSKAAYEKLGIPWDGYGFAFQDDRSNQDLVRVVEELGDQASGECAKLRVVEFKIGHEINSHDGYEGVSVWASEVIPG